MARRPQPEELDRPLTPEQLNERRRRLGTLSLSQLADEYREAHGQCAMHSDIAPRASAIQELVTAWKLMWMRRRNRREMGRG